MQLKFEQLADLFRNNYTYTFYRMFILNFYVIEILTSSFTVTVNFESSDQEVMSSWNTENQKGGTSS